MTFTVKVLLRRLLGNGRLHHEPLKHLNFSLLTTSDAPGKARAKARRQFNEAKNYYSGNLLTCVSGSYSDGVITLSVQSVRELDAQEEAARIAVGGAPVRNTPRSRHHE
jgi:hypothetical protein